MGKHLQHSRVILYQIKNVFLKWFATPTQIEQKISSETKPAVIGNPNL